MRTSLIPSAVVSVAVVALPPYILLTSSGGFIFRHHPDVYYLALNTPVTYLFPLLIALIACTGAYHDVGHRYVSNVRTRQSARQYLTRSIARAAALSFAIFFLYAIIPFVIAFYVWPAIGDPNIEPGVYGLDEASSIAESYRENSFGPILALGDLPFGVIYSLWMGAAAAATAALTIICLVTIKNRLLAFSTPFIVCLVQTVVAALLGQSQYGLVYSLVPFGFGRSELLAVAAPILVVDIGAIIATLWIRRRADTLERLA